MKKVLTIVLFLAHGVSMGQVNLNTGAAEVNIPVFSFQDNISRLKFDLNINYSSGNGLLVDEIPGDLGAGWELGGIPKIVRVQRGLPDDEYVSESEPKGLIYQNKFVEIQGCPIITNYYPLANNKNATYEDAIIARNDREVDEFNVFLNGRLITFYIRSKFAFSHDGISTRQLNAIDPAEIIAYNDQAIADGLNPRTRITRFEIKDDDGLIYVFAEREYAKVFEYALLGQDPESYSVLTQTRNVWDGSGEEYYVSGWALSEIIDKKNNRRISLTYRKQTLEYTNYTDIYAGSENSFNTDYMNHDVKKYPVGITHRKNKIIRKSIETINMPTGERLDFNYLTEERKDVQGAYALKDIIINSRSNTRISKVSLTTGFFVKNEIKQPAIEEESEWSRLCLIRVQKFGRTDLISEPPYSFEYNLGQNNTENFVPPIFFQAKDQWGYYNGDKLGLDITKIFNHHNTNAIDWRKVATQGSHRPFLDFESPIYTKTGYAGNGLLKSYTIPAGGSIAYLYEQNKAEVGKSPKYYVEVGGVHVTKVTKDYGINSNKEVVEYAFINSDGKSSLWGIEFPHSISKITTHYKKGGNGYKHPSRLVNSDFSVSGGKNTIGRFLDKNGSAIGNLGILIIKNPSPQGIIASMIIFIINAILGNSYAESTDIRYYFHQEPLNFSNPLPSQFSRVVVKTGSVNGNQTVYNGRTEYEFTSDLDFAPVIPTYYPGDPEYNPHFFTQSQRSHGWMYGLTKSIKVFSENENTPLKETLFYYKDTVTYDSHLDVSVGSINCQPVYFDSKKETDYNNLRSDISENYTTVPIDDKLIIDHIYIYAGYPILQKKEDITYSGAESILNTTYYGYNKTGQIQTRRTVDSKGEQVTQKIYYHFDFFQSDVRPANVYTWLWNNNRYNLPVATETWKYFPSTGQENLIESTIYEYDSISNGDIRLINEYAFESKVPILKSSIQEFSFITPPPINRAPDYFKLKSHITYDNYGGVIGISTPLEGRKEGVILSYDLQYPIATIKNGESNEIAYTSFETDEENNWEYNESKVIESEACLIGNKCYQLGYDYYESIKVPFPSNLPGKHGAYTLSFWATSPNVNIDGTPSTPVSNISNNGWYFFKKSLPANDGIYFFPDVGITGGGLIDEVRLYPADARMETFTYDELGNITTQCDENNRITYYEYDGLGRIYLIKDSDRNIIKRYEYHYRDQ